MAFKMTIDNKIYFLFLCYKLLRPAAYNELPLVEEEARILYLNCVLTLHRFGIDLSAVAWVATTAIVSKGELRRGGNKCTGKHLAAHAVHRHTCRPTISRQEAITIPSIFTAWPPPSLSLLFMSPFFSVLFFPSQFLIFMPRHHRRSPSLSSSLSRPLPAWQLGVDASVPLPPRELINECIRVRNTHLDPPPPSCGICPLCVDGFLLFFFFCAYMCSHLGVTWCSLMAGRGDRAIRQDVCLRIMENLTLISLIIGFYGYLYIRHKHTKSH